MSGSAAAESILANSSARIDALEDAILARGAAGDARLVDLPIVHVFTPGLYGREVEIPAGCVVTTHVHLVEHQYVLLSGSVVVYSGGESVRLAAPYSGITMPGTRRAIYAFEDTTWKTFHPISADEYGNVESVERRIFGQRVLADGLTVRQAHLRAVAGLRLGVAA